MIKAMYILVIYLTAVILVKARGIYAYVEFTTTPDANAKVTEYITAKKTAGSYVF